MMKYSPYKLSTLDQDVILTLSTATVTIEDNDSEYRTYTVASDINKEGGWCRSELRETGDGNL